MIRKYENFSGKIKLDTQEVIELISVLFELKPNLPDEFPTGKMSKLSDNTVTYNSDDDNFKIAIHFNESDLYIDRQHNIITGKFRTIFKIKITKNDNNFKISDVKEYIKFTSNIISESYDDVSIKVIIDKDKYILTEFDKLQDKNIEDILFIIKII